MKRLLQFFAITVFSYCLIGCKNSNSSVSIPEDKGGAAEISIPSNLNPEHYKFIVFDVNQNMFPNQSGDFACYDDSGNEFTANLNMGENFKIAAFENRIMIANNNKTLGTELLNLTVPINNIAYYYIDAPEAIVASRIGAYITKDNQTTFHSRSYYDSEHKGSNFKFYLAVENGQSIDVYSITIVYYVE